MPDSDAEIWYMDSDICECGGLIDDFGICIECGSDGVDYVEDGVDYIDDWYED